MGDTYGRDVKGDMGRVRVSIAGARGNKESSGTGNTWRGKGSMGGHRAEACDEEWVWHWGHRREMAGWRCEETWRLMGLRTGGANTGDMW